MIFPNNSLQSLTQQSSKIYNPTIHYVEVAPLCGCGSTTVYNMESQTTTLKYCGINRTHWSIVCAAPSRTPASNLWQLLHWLPIHEHIVFKIANITRKVRLHPQPSYLSDLIVDYILSWILHLSGTNLYLVQQTKTQIVACVFRADAPKIWNNLPHCIYSTKTKSRFTKQLKMYIFASVYG